MVPSHPEYLRAQHSQPQNNYQHGPCLLAWLKELQSDSLKVSAATPGEERTGPVSHSPAGTAAATSAYRNNNNDENERETSALRAIDFGRGIPSPAMGTAPASIRRQGLYSHARLEPPWQVSLDKRAPSNRSQDLLLACWLGFESRSILAQGILGRGADAACAATCIVRMVVLDTQSSTHPTKRISVRLRSRTLVSPPQS